MLKTIWAHTMFILTLAQIGVTVFFISENSAVNTWMNSTATIGNNNIPLALLFSILAWCSLACYSLLIFHSAHAIKPQKRRIITSARLNIATFLIGIIIALSGCVYGAVSAIPRFTLIALGPIMIVSLTIPLINSKEE